MNKFTKYIYLRQKWAEKSVLQNEEEVINSTLDRRGIYLIFNRLPNYTLLETKKFVHDNLYNLIYEINLNLGKLKENLFIIELNCKMITYKKRYYLFTSESEARELYDFINLTLVADENLYNLIAEENKNHCVPIFDIFKMIKSDFSEPILDKTKISEIEKEEGMWKSKECIRHARELEKLYFFEPILAQIVLNLGVNWKLAEISTN